MRWALRAAFAAGLLAAAIQTVWIGPAASEEWPARAVRIIVPYGPGGTTDHAARGFGEKLSTRFGQQFVIENRAGAGGALGVEAGAKSPPDGYTLILAPLNTLAITPHVRKTAYDPMKDFAFVGRVADSIFGMGVTLNIPATTLQEFIAYAKANPGKIDFGSAGPATATQFAGEALNEAANIKMQHIPYRGSADAMNDLLAGVIQVQFEGILFPHYKAGKIRILAVTTPERHPQFPKVPAIREIVPSYDLASWASIIAPAGTPRPIVDKLSAALNEAAKDRELKERLLAVGQMPRTDTPEDMAVDVRKQSERYAAFVQRLGLKE